MNKTIISMMLLLVAIQAAAFNIPDGEYLEYQINYGVINAGTATLTFNSEDYNGTPAWKIESNARTNSFFDSIFKVRDQIVSIWEKERLITLKYYKKLREGGYRQLRIHYYYPDQLMMKYVGWNFKKQKRRERTLTMLPDAQDILSSLYWARSQELEPDSSLFVNVSVDEVNYTAEVKVHRIETIDTPLGSRECYVLEPILQSDAIFKQTATVYVWITTDEQRVPVKVSSEISYGSFEAVLVKQEIRKE